MLLISKTLTNFDKKIKCSNLLITKDFRLMVASNINSDSGLAGIVFVFNGLDHIGAQSGIQYKSGNGARCTIFVFNSLDHIGAQCNIQYGICI